MATKKILRKKMLLLKQSLSRRQLAEQSRAVVKHLTRWPAYKKAKVVLFYSPLGKEVQIQPLLRRALAQKKRVCMPACPARRGIMRPYFLTSPKELVAGPFGALQPPILARRLAKRGGLDLLLVPGIAFDAHGRRLGRGRGCYDRFLAHWAGKAPVVGIALAEQVLPRVPAARHDVTMTHLAHPGGIISCE